MFNNKIRKIDISTREVSTFAGSGSYSKLDSIGMNASFQNTTAITSNGNHLFVIETGSKTIRDSQGNKGWDAADIGMVASMMD